MLWNRTMDGSVTGVNLVAVAENKGVWWSKVNNAMNECNAWFLFFYKSIQKNKTNGTFQSPSILKWIWRQCYTDTNTNTSFKRPFIKLEVSALDFPHTHSISKSRLAQLFKTKGLKHLHFSGIPYFSARSHLSKSPNQILHQLVSCFVNSIHPRRHQ